jgi:hypothetical protein
MKSIIQSSRLNNPQDTCKSPNCDSKRVSNSHCQFHQHQLKPIYNRYKKLQDELPLVIEDSSIPDLLKLYGRCRRIYLLRQEYRKKGFREEFWDFGHENVIDILWSKMQEIIKIIKKKIKEDNNKTEINGENNNDIKILNLENENSEEFIEEKDELDTKKIIKLHHKLEQQEMWMRRIPCLIKRREKYENNMEILNKIYINLIKHICLTTKENTIKLTTKFLEKELIYILRHSNTLREEMTIYFKNTIQEIMAIGDVNTDKYTDLVADTYVNLIRNSILFRESIWPSKLKPIRLEYCCFKTLANDLPKQSRIIKLISDTAAINDKTVHQAYIKCVFYDNANDILLEYEDEDIQFDPAYPVYLFTGYVRIFPNKIPGGINDKRAKIGHYTLMVFARIFAQPILFHQHMSDNGECKKCLQELRDNLSYGALH